MTKAEAIERVERYIDEAVERRAYYDKTGRKELGWRENSFINGLTWALLEIQKIETNERN